MATILNLEPLTTALTREQFRELCQGNPELQLERSPQGELILMSPVGEESSNQEATLITKVGIWNEQIQLGYVFSSATIFRLSPLQAKMQEYLDSGLKLGWLINPQQQAEIYRPACSPEIISLPAILSGEDVLPGFQLSL